MSPTIPFWLRPVVSFFQSERGKWLVLVAVLLIGLAFVQIGPVESPYNDF